MKAIILLSIGIVSVAGHGMKLVVQEGRGLPVTTFNLTFRVGSADDPSDKEGLAYLTARMLREGGVKEWSGNPARDRAAIEDFLFPFAANVGVSINKEQISFSATSSAEDAETIFNVLAQMLLAPAFSGDELDRLKGETLDALSKQMPREDQEELGKAALEQAVWGQGHPYSHIVEGSVAGVKKVTLEDVVAFHKSHFTSKRLTLGIGGVLPKGMIERAEKVFGALPEGTTEQATIPEPIAPNQLHLRFIKGPFEAVGVHLGTALKVTRSHPDFPALYLASTGFGKHRSFVGRLMRVVREQRGLNYGCYSYVEDFPHGGQSLEEPLQAARTRQAFTVWGRPTPLDNGCFLLRQILREVTQLASQGLTASEFALAKGHLLGSLPLQGASIERKLGYAIDASFYGVEGDALQVLQDKVKSLSRTKVNETIRRNIDAKKLHLVVVTPDPAKFKEQLAGGKCPIQYGPGITKPKAVLAEDAKISTFPVSVAKESIPTLEAESIFAD